MPCACTWFFYDQYSPPPPSPPPRARGVMFHNLTRSLHPLPLSFLQVELGYLRRYLRDLPQFPERALN